jgi:tetratricopeptide (TPR) repeat protein
MKKLILSITFLLLSIFIYSQNSTEEFIKKGIEYHDKGDYENAITTYKNALKLDPKSTLINYEISLSFFQKGDYKEAINYSDNVLKQKKNHMLQAYLTKGSALDMLGKTKKSIKLFEKALKTVEKHFLLYYNLGLNYYKINNLEKAEENFVKAIEQNANHASSHLLLANIHNRRGNTIQTLLATHYFLFLEPNSNRSKEAYQLLQKNFGGNVSKDTTKPHTINILLSNNNDTQFGAAELMVSLLEASKSLEENEGKSEDEMFIENTDSFFTILGELKETKNKSIWWTFYTTFFYDLAKSEHLETYCKYISQSENENSRKWLQENDNKLIEFDTWLNKQ